MTSEEPRIKLYWLNQSRAQRVVWLLEELKVPYDIEVFKRDPATFYAPPELEKIHPLGKSPVVTVTPPGGKPIVLAESAFISNYLCEHFPEGKKLVPARWKAGQEGKVGGETEEYMRYEYFSYYTEGSFMPFLVLTMVMMRMQTGAPFFIRPVVSMIANRVLSSFVLPNVKRHLGFLEQQLSTSSGDYLCGSKLTAADIMMSFTLVAAESRLDEAGTWEGGSWRVEFPKVAAYLTLLKSEEGYKKATEKVKTMERK